MSRAATNILIVDDDPSVRSSLAQIFKHFGHDVRMASDGFSALCEFRLAIPDILISDLQMPGMSGFELLSVVRRRFPQTHVIAMSGAFLGESVPVGVAADAFYQKGTAMGNLLEIMAAMTHPQRARVARGSTASSPVWIPECANESTDSSFVTIVCHECLRTFPQQIGAAVSLIQEAICKYCSTAIRFAIVQSAISGLERREPAEVPRGYSSL